MLRASDEGLIGKVLDVLQTSWSTRVGRCLLLSALLPVLSSPFLLRPTQLGR